MARERTYTEAVARIEARTAQIIYDIIARDNFSPDNAVDLRAAIHDGFMEVLRDHAAQPAPAAIDVPIQIEDELHEVFTRHGILSRAKSPMITDVIAWAARACRQSVNPTPATTPETFTEANVKNLMRHAIARYDADPMAKAGDVIDSLVTAHLHAHAPKPSPTHPAEEPGR